MVLIRKNRAQEEEMLGDFGQQGWDNIPDDDESSGGGSGSGGGMSMEERLYKYRFKIVDPASNPIEKERPATHRILMLSDAPYRIWEHNLYNIKTSHFTCICLDKNKLDDRPCPICDKKGADRRPYYVGFFSVIDMGQITWRDNRFYLRHRKWTDKNNEVHEDAFPRVLLAARRGSVDKPGVLKTLQWEVERPEMGGSLAGTIWDVTRNGKKVESCGDKWHFVKKIERKDFKEYLTRLDADPEKLQLEPIDLLTPGESGRAVLEPLPYSEMAEMVGWKSQSVNTRQGGRVEGAGYADGDSGHSQSGEQGTLPNTGGNMSGHTGSSDSGGYGPPDGDDIPF